MRELENSKTPVKIRYCQILNFYEVDKHVALAELPPHRVNVAIINFVDLVAYVVSITCIRITASVNVQMYFN